LLYQALCTSPEPEFRTKELLLYAPLHSTDIRWNFEKILFDREGKPYRRYPPNTEIFDMVPDIEALLAM
jgi:glutathione peroxidase-family protein